MIAGLLLAAGRSSRMGFQKLLIRYRGRQLVAHALGALLGSSVGRVVVVTGCDADAVTAVLDANDRMVFAHNTAFAEGLSTSLRVGLGAVDDADGVVVMLGDMPFVTPADIDALLAGGHGNIAVPVVGEVLGNPVYWPRRYFGEMRALTGDQGARALLSHHADDVRTVEMAGIAVLTDIDTPADLQRFM